MKQHSINVQLDRDLQRLDTLATWLDSRFTIPGTNIRFGIDFLIGLIPYAGDIIGFALSGILMAFMAKHGASGVLIGKMLGNILLDAIVGSIPLFGDIFDLQYKANRRNLKLLKEYHQSNRHRGGWGIVIGVLALVLALIIGMVVLVSYLLIDFVLALF